MCVAFSGDLVEKMVSSLENLRVLIRQGGFWPKKHHEPLRQMNDQKITFLEAITANKQAKNGCFGGHYG